MLSDAKVRAAKPRPKSYKLTDTNTGIFTNLRFKRRFHWWYIRTLNSANNYVF